jgi:hypothetical protein
MRTVEIAEILDYIPSLNITMPDYVSEPIPYPDPENPWTYEWKITDIELRHWLAIHAFDWSFMDIVEPGLITPDETLFKNVWERWLSQHSWEIQRSFMAIAAWYIPTSNYDRQEDSSTTESYTGYKETVKVDESASTDYSGNPGGYTETHTFSSQFTHSQNETEKRGPANSDLTGIDGTYDGYGTTEQMLAADDGDTKTVSKNIAHGVDMTVRNAGENTTTQSDSGSNSTTRTGKIITDRKTGTNGNTKEITGTKTDATTSYISGNIGVTTNQQMITEELKLRMSSFTDWVLKQFVHDCLFYLPKAGDE